MSNHGAKECFAVWPRVHSFLRQHTLWEPQSNLNLLHMTLNGQKWECSPPKNRGETMIPQILTNTFQCKTAGRPRWQPTDPQVTKPSPTKPSGNKWKGTAEKRSSLFYPTLLIHSLFIFAKQLEGKASSEIKICCFFSLTNCSEKSYHNSSMTLSYCTMNFNTSPRWN